MIANHSNVIGAWVFYPLIVLLIMVVSRNGIFDNWDWPLSLILIISVAGLAALASGMMLRLTARRARTTALKTINAERDQLISMRGTTRPAAPTLDQLNHAISVINNIRTEAFSPMSENPVLTAVMIPTGGLGLMELMIFLSRGGGLPSL